MRVRTALPTSRISFGGLGLRLWSGLVLSGALAVGAARDCQGARPYYLC